MNSRLLAPLLLTFTLAIQSKPAKADDLGCTVMLCFAASAIGGWQKVGECVPPVRKALRKMLRGWTPRCTFQNGDGQISENSFMRQGHEVYAQCDASYGPGYQRTINEFYFDSLDKGSYTLQEDDRFICENVDTGDQQRLVRNPTPDFIDVYIDGAFYSRTFWDGSQAAPDSEVPHD